MKFSLSEKQISLYLLPLLLLLLTWYGARNLATDPYWVDEVISAQRTGMAWYAPIESLMDIWNRTAAISDQVPGYYLLLGAWVKVAGTSPFAGRVLSLFFGLITIATIYQIGKRLKNPLAGLGAAVALSSSAFYVLFLHEMRTYSLLLALIALLIWFYWLIISGKITWWTQLGLIFAAAGMMYSYYLSIVVIASLCLYHLIFVPKNREWWRIVFLFGIAGASLLPWVLSSFSVFHDEERNVLRQIHTVDNLDMIAKIGAAFSNKNNAALFFVLLFALGFAQKSQRFAWFIFALVLALMIILNPFFGVFVNLRYALMLWVPLTILVGLGIARLAEFGLPTPIVLAVILLTGTVSVLDQKLTDEYDLPIRYLPWDKLTAISQNHEQAGDSLVFLASIRGDDWEGVHEDRVMPHYFHGSLINPIFVEDVYNLPDAALLAEGAALTSDAERLWLSYAPKLRSWRTGMFEEMLRENDFHYCGNFADTSDLYLDLYVHPRAIISRESYIFGEADAANAQLSPLEPIPPTVDDSLYLVHAWTLSEDLPRSVYSLAVHVLDENGNLVLQADYALPIDSFACSLTRLNTESLPSGTYRVRSFVYAWADGTRLAIDSAENEVILGEFQIQR